MSEKLSKKYTILCVDDVQNNLFTLNALLSTVPNIKTIDVLNANEALRVLLTTKVDLILSDVQMPEINGFEFAKMVKSNKKTRDIPIIFVTAVFKSEEFIAHGFEIGAVDYITKPIDDHQLINKLTLYLKIFDEKNRVIQREKRFYEIAKSIGDGIVSVDTEGKVIFLNDEAEDLLGFTQKELLGKKVHDYIHYKTIDNYQIVEKNCEVFNVIKNKKVYTNENEHLIKKDGTFLPVSLSTTPLYDDGILTGTVTVFRDKTNKNRIKSLEKEKIDNQAQIIHSMINMIEARDTYTAGHTRRVAKYCELLAKKLGHTEQEIETLVKAAWLHDIGKISTPDSVLLKPGKLNQLEYELIKEHLTSGYEMLSKIDQYKNIANIMREHHERYDGGGYPRGLSGNAILPLSRVMIVADAFDAMTTNRIYKQRKSVKEAIQELQDFSSKQFHPEVVVAATKAFKDVSIDEEISQTPKTSLEEQRFSYFYKDRLTNLFIIDYISLILRYYLSSDSVYLYSVKLHNFSKYNEKFSWKAGDEFLIKFSDYLNSLYRNTIVFRVEGDDFLLLSETKIDTISEKLDKFDGLKDSIVGFSVKESYVNDVKENNEKILDIIGK